MSDVYGIAEGLALSRSNPWSKLTPQEITEIKAEIHKQLTQIHSLTFQPSKDSALKASLMISSVQYFVYAIVLSVWALTSNADLGILWGVFLFYAPVLTLCMNYFLYPLSSSIRRHRSLVLSFDQVVGIGYERFLSSLEDLKYSSPPNSSVSRPMARLNELTPEQAEEFCASWLRSLGFLDAQVTRFSRDGGIDVESQHLCAQVKHQVAPVGVKAVRELFGVAVNEKKTPVFFALSDYTSEAKTFATKVGMPIIRYFPNSLVPLNQPGELLISQGPKFVASSRK